MASRTSSAMDLYCSANLWKRERLPVVNSTAAGSGRFQCCSSSAVSRSIGTQL